MQLNQKRDLIIYFCSKLLLYFSVLPFLKQNKRILKIYRIFNVLISWNLFFQTEETENITHNDNSTPSTSTGITVHSLLVMRAKKIVIIVTCLKNNFNTCNVTKIKFTGYCCLKDVNIWYTQKQLIATMHRYCNKKDQIF